MHALEELWNKAVKGRRAVICRICPGDEMLLKGLLDVEVWVEIDAPTEYKALQSLAGALGVEIPERGVHISLIKEELVKRRPKGYLALIGLEKLHKDALNSLLYFLMRHGFKLLMLTSSALELYARVRSSLGSVPEVDLRPLTEKLFLEKAKACGVEDGEALELLKMCNNNRFLAIRVLRHLERERNAELKDLIGRIALSEKVRGLNQHQRLLLKAIFEACRNRRQARSGEVYKLYRELCLKNALRPYTERTLLKWLDAFREYGLVRLEKIYGGRQGKTTKLSLTSPMVNQIFEVLEPPLEPP